MSTAESSKTPSMPSTGELVAPRQLTAGIEKTPLTVYSSSAQASRAIAREIADLIKSKAATGEHAILGLATGSTPTGVYDELIRLHREEGLSFKTVITFNLDEYYPMQPSELQSYVRFMREHLFDHIDIPAGNWHVPDGTIARDQVYSFCQSYERQIKEAGGLDFQLLGIGRTGHVGFNEPGSARESKTRLITLDRVTRMDAASDFFGEWNVPRKAITMGVDSIMSAKKVVLMAWGEGKAPVVKRAVEGEITAQIAASFLQQHPNARIVLDRAAAAELTRFKMPWLLGSLEDFNLKWDTRMTRKAAIWLSRTINKPLLKLTDEDYNEHGLQELVALRGGAYDINIEVFKAMQSTITGWPGGKKADEADGRAKTYHVPGTFVHQNPDVYPKRVVIFSPHPDDDVISMGGTLIRLAEQDHELHVAYQTSGNIAVFDEAALRHADFVREYARAFNLGEKQAESIEDQIERFVQHKQPGEADSPELQRIKGLIRRTEARAAARFSGITDEHIHFMDMPFYETGRVRKKPLGEEDIQITIDLLDKIKPHQVYAAGDLSDPHGTHRVCLVAVFKALQRLRDKQVDWVKTCEVWLYRGAWQEWGVDEIEMAVPLSPDEVARKRIAIFKHESQKDKALFPGSDQREFWQRAEDRNSDTAELYDKLGLAEYEAIEGFVRWDWQMGT